MAIRCLADIGGPFYNSAKPFRNWSALPFYQLDLPEPPYVDCEQLAWGLKRAEAYLRQIADQGYSGIVVDNLAHLVGFERAPEPIYAPDSPFRQRALIYRAAFQRLFAYAAHLGLEAFVTTDMQWSTPPLRHYAGRLDPRNPRLAAANRWAFEELFTALPHVRGVFVRVGETGGAHNQGTAYAGHMIYTTAAALRGLIDTLLPVCAAHDRLLVVRTWSIGIGELGDLMWSPERYRAVFTGYTSPHLLVSVKHGPSDFFRLLPHNPTLGLEGPRQIIELQNRREYELFGMVPSAVVPLHQDVLRHAAANPHYDGVWAWNGSGGWGGGTAVLGDTGWSFWTELSSAVTAALAADPQLDAQGFVLRWCVEQLGEPFGTAVARLYLESADLIERGWYLGWLEAGERAIGSLYLPSLMWIWWMRPTASQLIWSYIAAATPEREALIQRGEEAVARLATLVEQVMAVAPTGDARAAAIVDSAHYFYGTLAATQPLRALMLRAFAAARAGDNTTWRQLSMAAGDVRAGLRRYATTWRGRTDLPPLELDEVDAFLRTFARMPGLLWMQARLAYLVVELVRRQRLPRRRMYLAGVLGGLLLMLSIGGASRRNIGIAGALTGLLLAPPVRRRAFRVALPWLSRRFYLLPSIFFETGPSFTEWTA